MGMIPETVKDSRVKTDLTGESGESVTRLGPAPTSLSRKTSNGKISGGREVDRKGICDGIERQLEHLGKWSTWMAILLGQVLSGLMCVSSFTIAYLTDTHLVHIPNAQNFTFYFLLSAIFTTILLFRPAERNFVPVLKSRGWLYAFVALTHAEGNFLSVKAYQLTTLTSVQLLQCFAIPTVLSLSWIVLRIRYKLVHILGVLICLLGICCLVWADIEEGRQVRKPARERFLGDMLSLSGAFLCGMSNVAEEFAVKTFDVVEFLGMIGLFGSCVSGIQTMLLEYESISSLFWTLPPAPLKLMAGYASAQLAFCVISAIVIKLCGATAFNLSILTGHFYSLIMGIYLCQLKFHALYFLSFVLVMTGVIVFAIKPTEIASHIYKSLTREHTTALDLELMASTPGPTCSNINSRPNATKDYTDSPSAFTSSQKGSGCDTMRSTSDTSPILCNWSGTSVLETRTILCSGKNLPVNV